MPLSFDNQQDANEYAKSKKQEGYETEVKREGNFYKVKVLGFTGTQKGMTESQKEITSILMDDLECKEVHHGDCIGADTDFHKLAQEKDLDIVIHPASGVGDKRAYNEGAKKTEEEKPPLVRNWDIVEKSDAIIATPKGNKEEIRSGTWATIRYAKKKGKKLFIVNPDGSYQEYN